MRELCGVTKGVDKRIDEGVLQWFGYMERMENDRIAKSLCSRVCWLEGRPQKILIDTVKECLRKKDLDVRPAKRMVQDKE